MIAGTLEIQLLANMARLQNDMDAAKRSVGGAMADIDKMAAMAKSSLGALGGVLTVGMFAGWVRGAIDAADSLNDLSKSTGIAVEQLAGLKLASKQSGAELDGTAQAINKLSVKMGENADKYAKIGITAKQPLEAFKQLADIYVKIDDPQQRAAFGAEALGKSWGAAAPLLAEGSAGIQEMVDKGARLSGMTQDAADQADAFNDRMAELETVMGAAALSVAKDVMPILTAFAESMVDSKGDTDDLAGAFPKLSEVLRVFIVFGGNVMFTLTAIGREIGGIAAQAAAIASGDFKAAFGKGGIGDMMKDDAVQARAAFDAWEAKMLSAGTTAADTSKKIIDASEKQTAAEKAGIAAFIAGEKEKKAAKSALETALESFAADAAKREALLTAESGAVAKLTDTEKWAIEVMVKVRDGKLGQSDAERTLIASRVAAVVALEKLNLEEKRMADLEEKAMGLRADAIATEQAKAQSLIESTGALREQSAELGLTVEALAALKQARIDDQIAGESRRLASLSEMDQEGAMAGSIRETIAALEDHKLAMQENDRAQKAADAIKAQGEVWKSIDDTAHQTFVSIFDSGKSAFDRLRDTLKNGLLDMLYQMTVKKWIISIAASTTGAASAQSAFGTTASGASSLGSLGNIASLGQSAWGAYTGGIGSAYGAFAGSGVGSALGLSTATAAGYMAPVYGAGGTLLSAGSGTAAGGLTAAGSTIGAALPYVGLAVAAATLISSLMGKRGGAKTEGDAYAALSASGISSYNPTDATGDNYITGGGSDASVKSILAPVGTSIASLLKSIGGSAAGIGLSLGFSTDTKGTAKDNIQSGVTNAAGEYVYRSGRNTERGTYQTEMALEVQRMMVAAVRASDVAQIYKDVTNGIDLATASAETLTQTLSDVSAVTALRTAFDNLNFGAGTLSTTIISAAGGISSLTSSLDSYYGNYFTEAERTAKTADAVAKQFAAMGIAMPASKEAFRALTEQVMATGDAGAETFAKLMGLEAAFSTVADAATATAKAAADSAAEQAAAAKAASDAIKASFLSLYGTLTNALASASTTSGPTIGSRNYALGSLDYAVSSVQSGQSLLSYSDLITSAITELSKSSETLYSTFEDYAMSQARATASITYLQGNAYSNSHADGLASVPYDGYQATLHAGEAVVDAQSTAAIKRYFGGGGDNSALISEIQALREEVIGLRAEARATASATGKSAQLLERVMPDGDALATRATA